MAYCTRDNLVQRFGEREIDDLLDRDNNSVDDTDTLSQTIADADSLIDSYVSSKYQTPLDQVPQIIKYISCDITRFMLWDDNAPEEVRNR
jgi:phage gp36-like protein